MGLFRNRVKVNKPLDGLSSMILPTGVKDVITFAGSFLGGSLFSLEGNQKIAAITALMLDKGTESKDKYTISDILESTGSELSFSSTRHHVQFTGHCLRVNIEVVIKLLAEQLRTPAFPRNELSTLKTRLIGSLKQSKEDTKKQALIELLRNLYPKGHPNYRTTTDEEIDKISSVRKKELKAFHHDVYGLGELNFTAVGDVDQKQINTLLKKQFGGWKNQTIFLDLPKLCANPAKGKEKNIHIPDKTSADVYLGQPIGIDRDHKDYYPLMMAIYILGGNFSARLMHTVRDQQGLTYGIGSSVAGASFGNDGYWSTWGTFSPDLLDKGKKAALEQILKWYNDGVTLQELEAKKTTITGSYQVSMDSTGGLTAKILSNAERGKTIEHLDQYPDIIRSLKLEQVNNAIRQYVDPEKLTVIAAGTLSKA